MNKPKISLIAALSENKVIGNKGKIPWHISEDWKRFKKLTEGHLVIMGRKTFKSIGKLLPNRINIIITRDPKFSVKDGVIYYSLDEAIKNFEFQIKNYNLPNEVFIIGGGQIFSEAIKSADKLYLTIVKGNFEGDAYFPDYSQFKKVVYKKESTDGKYQYTFLELEK